MFNAEKKAVVLPKSDKSSMEAFKTGDWRTLKPEMRVKNSACKLACPIGNRIRDYLQLIREGQIKEAWELLIETNPLPAVLGRVCPHPCEEKCLRGQFDQSVAINTIEGFLGELALEKGWRPENIKQLIPRLHMRQRIAIVGAGPSGLACAYQLRRLGHWVDIFEAEKELGGMLYFGIPRYRLPKDLLRREIENNILSLEGIKVNMDASITRPVWPSIVNDFDAVLIATGNSKSRKLKIDGEEKNHQIISGLGFLRKVNLGQEVNIGDVVVVIGGGNTAIDAARLAKKLGCKSVSVLYRRREEDMPAFKEEIKAAKNEGIEMMPLVSPVLIERRCDGLLKIDCVKIELREPDKSGRLKPIPIAGSQYIAFAHNLITAVGEESDLSFMTGFDDDKFPLENIFVAGDASLNGAGTVAGAIASGNRLAQEIGMYLETGERREIICVPEKVVQFSDLNSEYLEYKYRDIKSIIGSNRPVEQ
ncbi:MAG: FAD-dependent oxidoreductase, partial [bacterium]|nr:FAD-dependent oxidoreductase [bacterium]